MTDSSATPGTATATQTEGVNLDRARAQPVGSLLRPEYLKAARAAMDEGSLSVGDYKRVEDRAVNEAIAMQEDVGLDVITDGEQRRLSYVAAPFDALSGWMLTDQAVGTEWFTPEGEQVEQKDYSVARTKLTRRRSAFVEEFSYSRAKATVPVKVTVPSPMGVIYAWHPELSKDAYPDPFDLFADVARFLREDIEDLVALGCEYVQVDAPEFTIMVDERRKQEFRNIGVDPERVVTEGVAAINTMVAGLEGIRLGLHLCRGNWDGTYMAEGSYDAIANTVFQHAQVNDFFLEFDDERSGSFEALTNVPRDKHVYLGLVTTKHGGLESEDVLKRRIEEAGQYFPHDHLGICTQCGFASGWGGNHLSEEAQRAKLEIVAKVAREVWS